MKRILLLLVLLVFGLLSACGAAMDEEPDPLYVEAPMLRYRLGFDWTTMTYSTSLDATDLLRDSGTITEDYWLMRDVAGKLNLSQVQQDAYNETLIILNELAELSLIELDEIGETSLADINDYASFKDEIVITPTVAFTYNAIQSEVESLRLGGSYSITRLEYLESKLDRSLSTEEVDAFNLLQSYIVEIYLELDRTYMVKTETFDGLIIQIEIATGEPVAQDTIDTLQIGYDIVQELHSTE